MELKYKSCYQIVKSDNIYEFKTRYEKVVKILFVESGITTLGFPVFSICIENVETTEIEPIDHKIGNTLAHVISDFLESYPDSYLFFYCYGSDGRARLRFNRFVRWIEGHNQMNLVLTNQKKLPEIQGYYGLLSPPHLALFADAVMDEIENL